jgi:carbon-monoxide dehydrogenase medium subunit
VILPEYDYLEPATIAEACAMLNKGNGKAAIIAGGTDLLVNMKKSLVKPDSLVSLASLTGLNKIQFDERNGLSLGPLVTVAQVNGSDIIRDRFPALHIASGKLGSPQVRNRATVGGNICTARPAADLIGPLMAYGATVSISNGKKERSELLENIFKGPGQTTLAGNEILTGIKVKTPAAHAGASYIKYGIRKVMEISVVNVTVVLTFKDLVCTSARVILGAVAPTFLRFKTAEDTLTGQKITNELAQQTGRLAADYCRPISDIRASAEYRRELVKALTARGIIQAMSTAHSG